jgi:hypothetical protein
MAAIGIIHFNIVDPLLVLRIAASRCERTASPSLAGLGLRY